MPFHPCGQFVETLIPRELEFRCHVTVADNPSQFLFCLAPLCRMTVRRHNSKAGGRAPQGRRQRKDASDAGLAGQCSSKVLRGEQCRRRGWFAVPGLVCSGWLPTGRAQPK